MADQDQLMVDPPTTEIEPTAQPPADTTTTNGATTDEKPAPTSEVVDSIEVEPKVKEEDAQADAPGESDAEGEDDDDQPADSSGRPVSNELYKALKAISDILTEFKIKKGGDDYYPSLLFRRVPNKRNLPDYYQVIKEPSAISTLKGKIQRKSYTGIPEFVRDFALIVHNAQLYNRPNSQPVRDVFQLDAVFKAELQKLVEQGLVKEEETVFPDLGEIPAATPEPDPVSEEEEEDGDEEGEDDDEDDDGDGDDSDDARRKRRRGRPSAGGTRKGDDDDKDDNRKRRGRPPKVDTPMEARIKSVIKSLRKPKDDQGAYRLRHFERLPDRGEYPHYYQEIKEPIAMDTIKKKAKRKKYNSLDHFMKDVDLMFKNAMSYNVDGSEIYEDAKVLLVEAHQFAEAEQAKPDEEYLLDDGRVPLPSGIEHKGEIWKIGDWIHIQNPNDVTKPIVAQIYRTWRDSEGQEWINACWYYRPEQTVHQHEKHFYPAEVVKTGQYRDHHIQEVIDRCFVMFFTRYNRGRPRNLDPKTEVYVCEARYNEEKHKFNKIKTWASCLPDEVRDKDYEMDLFDVPRRIKKVPSPIKHLMKENAREDEVPTPQWGNKNAPPIVGGVKAGKRDENQSPPPEPTPPPPTPPPAPIRAASNMANQYPQQASMGTPHGQPNMTSQGPRPLSMTPALRDYPQASASPVNYNNRPALYPQHSSGYQSQGTPVPRQGSPYGNVQQIHPAAPYQNSNQSYNATAAAQSYQPRQTIQQVQAQAQQAAQYQQQQQVQQPQQPQYPQYPVASLHERHHETYVLSDAANAAIPKDIRERFPQDDEGRVLFFTKPPLDTRRMVTGRSEREKTQPLAHTKEYLEAKTERDKLIKERKRAIQESIDRDDAVNGGQYKRLKAGTFGEERDADGRIKANPAKAAEILKEYKVKEVERAQKQQQEVEALQRKAIDIWRQSMGRATANEYRHKYGDKALQYFEEDVARSLERDLVWKQKQAMRQQDKQPEMSQDEKIRADTKRMLSQNFWTGRYPDGSGRFEDDFDNRLPRPS